MTLLLTTPEQHSFQDPSLERNEKKLQRWLTGLPVLNAGESLRMVLNALEPLNEQRLESDERLSLLAVYQATVDRLYTAAEPLRLRQQPLSRQQRQDTVDDVERLCLAMANGYKIVIKELNGQGDDRDAAKFAHVLRLAMRQLAAALLHSYRFYRPEPAYVFLEVNQIYRLARHFGVHDAREDDQNGVKMSLADIYQAACMLSMCDPFSLEEGMADSFYSTLLHYAGAARIVPGNNWQGVPEGLFFIDLQGDSRPRHCVYLQSPVEGDDPHILDARSGLQQMHQTLAALPADRRRKRAEAGILRALLPEVAPLDKRRSERRPDGRWIGMVSGLASIGGWLAARLRGEKVDAAQWRVKDSSEGGYCLAWDESAASLLQVGDLACVVSDSDQPEAQTLQLMVVRWVRDAREDGTEIGVELIEGQPNPVRYEVVGDAQGDMQHALFMPSGSRSSSQACLITPREVYEQNRSLLIYVGEREIRVRCTELVEQAPEFDCFEFTSGA